MDFRLADPSKTHHHAVGDAKIFYTEATPAEMDDVYNRHMVPGLGEVAFDIAAIKTEILSRHVTGWSGVTLNGEPTDFDFSLFNRIRGPLRDEVYALIVRGADLEAKNA